MQLVSVAPCEKRKIKLASGLQVESLRNQDNGIGFSNPHMTACLRIGAIGFCRIVCRTPQDAKMILTWAPALYFARLSTVFDSASSRDPIHAQVRLGSKLEGK